MFLRDVFTPQKEETMVLGTSFIQLTFIKTIIFSSNCTFKMWCWRRLLRIFQTERRSNQSIQEEINPEYSLEGLMLKVNLQCFGHLMQRVGSLERP